MFLCFLLKSHEICRALLYPTKNTQCFLLETQGKSLIFHSEIYLFTCLCPERDRLMQATIDKR